MRITQNYFAGAVLAVIFSSTVCAQSAPPDSLRISVALYASALRTHFDLVQFSAELSSSALKNRSGSLDEITDVPLLGFRAYVSRYLAGRFHVSTGLEYAATTFEKNYDVTEMEWSITYVNQPSGVQRKFDYTGTRRVVSTDQIRFQLFTLEAGCSVRYTFGAWSLEPGVRFSTRIDSKVSLSRSVDGRKVGAESLEVDRQIVMGINPFIQASYNMGSRISIDFGCDVHSYLSPLITTVEDLDAKGSMLNFLTMTSRGVFTGVSYRLK